MPAMRVMFSVLLVVISITGVLSDKTTVNIEGLGKVRGTIGTTAWTSKTIYKYFNIPYAQSPAITGRFKPAQEVLPWNTIYNATIPRRACPQVPLLLKNPQYDQDEDPEDCLTLNVYTPKLSKKSRQQEKLPVMVYFNGGGFYIGTNEWFPPEYLLEKNIILVVPQYRLTIFGLLCLHTENIPGNTLFMDQLMALEWVNKHISNFGGDPDQVTIFGQSAGGASVNMMLVSPIVSENLFQRAIIQSGAALSSWVMQNDPIKYTTDLYVQLTGNKEAVDVDEMVAAFENATITQLLSSYINMPADSKKGINGAVLQQVGVRKFITQHPNEYINQGKFKTLDLMAGVTKDEGSYFSTVLYDMLEPYNLQNSPAYLRNNLTTQILTSAGIKDPSGAIVDIFNDKYFKKVFDSKPDFTFADVEPGISDMLATLHIKASVLQQARANANYKTTFLYTFDYKGQYTRFGYGGDTSKYPFEGGVSHSDDLLYLFPYHYPLPLNEKDTEMSKTMVDLWTSFAINGVPSSPLIHKSWAPMEISKNGPYLHINSTSYMDTDFVHNEYDQASRNFYKDFSVNA